MDLDQNLDGDLDLDVDHILDLDLNVDQRLDLDLDLDLAVDRGLDPDQDLDLDVDRSPDQNGRRIWTWICSLYLRSSLDLGSTTRRLKIPTWSQIWSHTWPCAR